MLNHIPGEVLLRPARRRLRLPGAPLPETAQRAVERTTVRLVTYLLAACAAGWVIYWLAVIPV